MSFLETNEEMSASFGPVLRPSATALPRGRAGWPLVALLALVSALWLLFSFAETVRSTVAIWLRSDTYAHGLLVVPIAAYLVWRERHAVERLTPQPSLLGLVLFTLGGALWLLGRMGDVDAAQQFSVVVMLVSGTWALLGIRVVERLWFPLTFLVFAVPVGDFLLPPLMNFTADFTVATLRLTGIPVYREGNTFQIPSGSWSVIEACSGLRYLIASLTLGALYAYLSYRSWWKRVMFVLFSILAPILANGIRAYFIVMLGHVSNMKLAVGVDHLIYGWIFFGLVMMLMFWIGSLWRDNPALQPEDQSSLPAPPDAARQAAAKPSLALPVMAAIMAAVSAFWPAYAERIAARYIKTAPHLSTPLPVGDWQITERTFNWSPQFRFERAELQKTYAKGDRNVSVHLKYYRHQIQDLEMINSGNTIASTHSVWNVLESRPIIIHLGGREVGIRETRLHARDSELLVWHWFNVAATHTANEPLAKLLQAKLRITHGSDDAAAIFLAAPANDRGVPAKAVLTDFVAEMWPSIDETLRRAKR
jgi:exosortase A